MKKITLLLLMLTAVTAFAKVPAKGSVTVFSTNGSEFYLELNGERINTTPQESVTVQGLPNPYYVCKIVFVNRRMPAIVDRNLALADAYGTMLDVAYRIDTGRRGSSKLSMYASKPAKVLYGNHNGYHGNDAQDNYNGYNGGYTTGGNYNTAMSDADFNEALATINNSSFDSTKLSIAKQVVSVNNLYADQVYTLLNTLTFDSSKLELAKYAYTNCVDKSNYFKVLNAFTFSSSKTELIDYISRQH